LNTGEILTNALWAREIRPKTYIHLMLDLGFCPSEIWETVTDWREKTGERPVFVTLTKGVGYHDGQPF